MSIDITIQGDLKKLNRSLKDLQHDTYPKVAARTLNRVAESAKIAGAKHIASQIQSRQASVKRRIETRKSSYKKLWAELVAHGRPLQLIEFVVGSKKPTQQPGGKRRVVKTKVFGKRKTYKQAFIAPRRAGDSNTTIYVRKGNKRKPLRMMFGPGIKQLFKREDNLMLMESKVKERLTNEFICNAKFYIAKQTRP